jgi:hypothetical protein
MRLDVDIGSRNVDMGPFLLGLSHHFHHVARVAWRQGWDLGCHAAEACEGVKDGNIKGNRVFEERSRGADVTEYLQPATQWLLGKTQEVPEGI